MTKTQYLPQDEIEDFWALGIPLEADYVPEEEWQRALATERVQEVSSWSSMGTAETGWVRASGPTTKRESAAVVPPGKVAEQTPYGDMADDRDTIAVCWKWFWMEQERALRHITDDKRDTFLEECARMLVELERAWKEDADDPNRVLLVDWLISANKLAPETLAAELAAIKNSALAHLVSGVRARWLTRDLDAAYSAVLTSAERGPKSFWGHGNIEKQREVRMQLLRFIVRMVRHS